MIIFALYSNKCLKPVFSIHLFQIIKSSKRNKNLQRLSNKKIVIRAFPGCHNLLKNMKYISIHVRGKRNSAILIILLAASPLA